MAQHSRSIYGTIGFCLSLVPWLAYVINLIIEKIIGKPEDGWAWPYVCCLAFAIYFCTPSAFVLSVTSLFADREKHFAIIGAILSGVAGFVFICGPFFLGWDF